jgi:hypothetical protein
MPAGTRHRGRRALLPFLAALAASAASAACAGDGDREVLPPVVLGMLETTPPAYDDGQVQVYQVAKQVRLPYRRMDDGERPRGERAPYPRPAFHVVGDSRVTVRFTLSNLEDAKRTVELLVDPWNEFVRYVPGVSALREDEIVPNYSGIQRTFILEPKARIEGIITPDDMVELGMDLTVAMALDEAPPDPAGDLGGPTLFNRAFERQNRSSEPDVVLAAWSPGDRKTVAAVIGFDVGLRTAEPARVAVELVIDIQDLHGERVVLDDEEDRKVGRPGNVLTPPAAARRM